MENYISYLQTWIVKPGPLSVLMRFFWNRSPSMGNGQR